MNQNPIAEHIRAERCWCGYTQEELAGRLGVTKAAVSKWECGQSAPDIALLPKLASLFSVTLDELLGYEPLASVEKRSEVQAHLQLLLGDDIAQALDYANDQAALHWSDSELLRMVVLLAHPENPPFFESVQEYLWDEGDEATDAAREESADAFCAAFAKRFETDARWSALRENPRFAAVALRVR